MGGIFIVFNKRIIKQLICFVLILSTLPIKTNAKIIAGLDPQEIIEYTGYLNDDTTYSYFPHDDIKNHITYVGKEVKVLNYPSVNKYKKVILNNEVCWIKEKYISEINPVVKTLDIAHYTRKSFMDFRTITSQTSDQWKMQYSNAYTGANGIRMVKNRYCIAVGSYFSQKIGTKIDLLIKQKDGSVDVARCILADCKADIHTYNNHIYGLDGGVAEFLVTTEMLSQKAQTMGDVSYTDDILTGDIIKVIVYK